MRRVFFAMQTELLEFKARFDRLLIFGRKIIDAFAFCAFEFDEIFLRHTFR